mmetsp:Transcript_15867/g.21105  ORF Transcript_15867/g.21105 Transcript_15867/m.21105 type:complete len:88 (+) Transcript_15867:164-427(+)
MPSPTSVYLSLINGLAKQRKKVRNGFQKDGMHDPLFCPHFDQTRNNLTVTHISQTQTLISFYLDPNRLSIFSKYVLTTPLSTLMKRT